MVVYSELIRASTRSHSPFAPTVKYVRSSSAEIPPRTPIVAPVSSWTMTVAPYQPYPVAMPGMGTE